MGRSFHYAENKHFLRVNSQSRAFAAIPGGTIVGPLIELQIVKILDHMDLKLQFHHPMLQHGHPMFMISRGKSRFVDEIHIPMPNSDPVQNYSLNFRKQEEENLAWHSRRLASRRLVRPMFQVRLASRKLVRTPSAFLLAKRPFSHKEPFLHDREEVESYSCQFIAWRSSVQVASLQNGYKNGASLRPKMNDNPDAALHWDTMRPVLLKAFAKHGVQDFSEKHWLRLVHEGSSKTRFEYCEDSQKFLGLPSSNSRTLWWNNN